MIKIVDELNNKIKSLIVIMKYDKQNEYWDTGNFMLINNGEVLVWFIENNEIDLNLYNDIVDLKDYYIVGSACVEIKNITINNGSYYIQALCEASENVMYSIPLDKVLSTSQYLINYNNKEKNLIQLYTSNYGSYLIDLNKYDKIKNTYIRRGISGYFLFTDNSVPIDLLKIPIEDYENNFDYYLTYLLDSDLHQDITCMGVLYKDSLLFTYTDAMTDNSEIEDFRETSIGFSYVKNTVIDYDEAKDYLQDKYNEAFILLPIENFFTENRKQNPDIYKNTNLGTSIAFKNFNAQEWQNKASFIRKLNNKKNNKIL